MYPRSLAPDEWLAFDQALQEGTHLRCRMVITDWSHNILRPVPTAQLLPGSEIRLSRDSLAERRAAFNLLNPNNELGITPGVLLWPTTHVWVDGLGRWVAVPQGAYRPLSPRREGHVWQVECSDKSSLHLAGCAPSSLPQGRNVVAAIQSLLSARGETHFRFPPESAVNQTLQRDTPYGGQGRKGSTLSQEELQPWPVLWRIARGAQLRLLYDNEGYAALRFVQDANSEPVVRWGRSSALLPSASEDWDQPNQMIADGAGNAKKIVTVPEDHILHPSRLLYGGKEWRNTVWADSNLRASKLEKWARGELGRDAEVAQETRVVVRLAPHVEPDDRIEVDGVARTFTDGVIAFGPGTESSVGWEWKVTT